LVKLRDNTWLSFTELDATQPKLTVTTGFTVANSAQHHITKDSRILRQKIANSACHFCKLCANSAQHFNPFFYGTTVCDTGVLSRVSWLVGPLKL